MARQIFRRRSLPPAPREEPAGLPSTKISPHNSATATAVSVTRYAYRRCRAMSLYRRQRGRHLFDVSCSYVDPERTDRPFLYPHSSRYDAVS
jgi:hypothetical protein